jgi:hypothetical protein
MVSRNSAPHHLPQDMCNFNVNTITARRGMSNTDLWMGLYQVTGMPKRFHSKPRTGKSKNNFILDIRSL